MTRPLAELPSAEPEPEPERPAGTSATTTVADGADEPLPESISPTATCYIEIAKYNPDYRNDNSTILWKNNCYNYATNRRTDTFAQPGKGANKMYTKLACKEVGQAALADGMRKRGECLPESEKPRWLTALVIAPGWDIHWYRLHLEKFWGHKPGGTKATNLDDSREVIYNPETADRGSYTQFCGYYYSGLTHQNTIK